MKESILLFIACVIFRFIDPSLSIYDLLDIFNGSFAATFVDNGDYASIQVGLGQETVVNLVFHVEEPEMLSIAICSFPCALLLNHLVDHDAWRYNFRWVMAHFSESTGVDRAKLTIRNTIPFLLLFDG